MKNAAPTNRPAKPKKSESRLLLGCRIRCSASVLQRRTEVDGFTIRRLSDCVTPVNVVRQRPAIELSTSR